jgi:isoleucyl-tRNA synthetase
VCLGHILDEDGRKMSKHLGNVLEPIPLMDEHGADAVRWFMLASGSPWQARRVGHAAIADVVRKTLLTYWNTVSFQSLYARTAQWTPDLPAPAVESRPVIDRWLLSAAYGMAAQVDAALENFDTQRAGRAIARFIDDMSNWYVRRSRRRFWDGDPAALATLHEGLRVVTLCLAPFTPFITERVWQDLFVPTEPSAPLSVHLSDWPAREDVIDAELEDQMALVRRLVELGRAARASSSVRTRQPLGRAVVTAPGWAGLPADLREQIAEELNVHRVEEPEAGTLVDVSAKANFRALGQRFAKQTPAVAQAIAATDAAWIAEQLRDEQTTSLDVPGMGLVDIGPDDVIITETPQQGWSVESAQGESVALDLVITPELHRAGLAREFIRAIQEARKQAGFAITDRIDVSWDTDDEQAQAALAEYAGVIADDVLALRMGSDVVIDDGFAATIDGLVDFQIALSTISP